MNKGRHGSFQGFLLKLLNKYLGDDNLVEHCSMKNLGYDFGE